MQDLSVFSRTTSTPISNISHTRTSSSSTAPSLSSSTATSPLTPNNKKINATTILDEPWKELTTNLQQLVIYSYLLWLSFLLNLLKWTLTWTHLSIYRLIASILTTSLQLYLLCPTSTNSSFNILLQSIREFKYARWLKRMSRSGMMTWFWFWNLTTLTRRV